MKCALALIALLLASGVSYGQDPQWRQEAVQLLERAHAVSSSPSLPNLERTVTFRVLDSATGPQEGTFTRVVVQGTGSRDEFSFGDFHVINVLTPGRLATTGTNVVFPPVIHDVRRLTPIYLVSFDHEDVIYAITDSQQDGRPLRCVEFNTVAGEKTDNNEICVDAASGRVVTQRLAKELIENRDFFTFAGELIPGKIRYSYAGVPKLEIAQAMSVIENPTPNVLAAPPNAQILQGCRTFRRAFGLSMPQPKPGNGGEDTDIVLRGVIGPDGKVHDAVVQESDRPDLNAEALSVIQQWTFTPALCNGQPNDNPASITLHFKAR